MNIKNNQFDVAIVIGRFQPFHNGHQHLLDQAKKVSSNILVLVGSAFKPRDEKNPFTFNERAQMIHSDNPSVNCFPIGDNPSDQLWAAEVQQIVNDFIDESDAISNTNIKDVKIALVGHRKDHTSFYLDLFPEYDLIEVESLKGSTDGTAIRTHMFFDKPGTVPLGAMPSKAEQYVISWMKDNPEIYQNLRDSAKFHVDYKKRHQFVGPLGKNANDGKEVHYSPLHVAVDAVVLCQGHILLIRRRTLPGKGLWALPGGFVREYERLEDAVIRELREETRIKISDEVLRASIQGTYLNDDPKRSLRGRVITNMYLFVLQHRGNLPKTRGSDDADRTKWVPISEFMGMEEVLFEDHYKSALRLINRS